jgi:Mg-chelatase subunit ChlD
LAQSGLPIQIVPMDSPPPDARVAALQCRRLPDASVAIQVTAASNAPLRRRLTVRRKGLQAPLLDRDLLLVPETPATARLADSPPGDRVEVYTACLAPGDDFTENDELSAAVLPLAQRFAIIGPADASAFLTAIGAVLQPAEVLDPGAAPSGAAGWVPYSAVVLVDGRGTLLSAPARAALGQYVRDGGGLVLLGCGPCDSPADRHDGLNTVAALLADPYQRQPLRLVVVLDASGSMRERTGPNGLGPRKFDLAQEAVLSLQRHLTANDSLAVVKYADTAALIYDSGARPPDFHVLGDALSAVEPTGQTKVIPALKLAVSSAAPEGKVGLVLLVSDLLTEKLEADKMPEVDKVERDFKDGHWRLSIVATKGANDVNEGKTLLDELARAARLDAQLVRREGLSALAEVFERFIRQGRGQAVARGDFQVTFQKALPLRQTVQWPRIDAYIPSAPQEGAEVLASVGSDAVLALRQVGLGRSAGLALPLSPPDNRLLAQSAPLLEVLTALRQWVQRPGDDPRFTGRLRRQAGRIDLTVEARDQNGPMNHLVLAAVCSAEPSSPLPPRGLSLEQIAPGVYRARIPAAGGLVSLAVRDDQGRIVWREALNDPYAPEYAAIGANWENLRRLADLTGGRIIRRQDLPDLGRRLAAQGLSPLWPWLLAGALLLMLADWCATRILRKR